jgi:hypothetical protein
MAAQHLHNAGMQPTPISSRSQVLTTNKNSWQHNRCIMLACSPSTSLYRARRSHLTRTFGSITRARCWHPSPPHPFNSPGAHNKQELMPQRNPKPKILSLPLFSITNTQKMYCKLVHILLIVRLVRNLPASQEGHTFPI